MSAKKRVIDDEEDDSSSLSSVEDESPVKSSKKKKVSNDGDSKSKNSSTVKGPNGEELMDLTGKKFVSVNEFKGKIFVNIREYYEDASGKLKPGKKGIALNRDQWIKFKSNIEEIDKALKDIL